MYRTKPDPESSRGHNGVEVDVKLLLDRTDPVIDTASPVKHNLAEFARPVSLRDVIDVAIGALYDRCVQAEGNAEQALVQSLPRRPFALTDMALC